MISLNMRLADLAAHGELLQAARDDARLVIDRDPDLKSERATGELVVRAFHREEGVRASGALDDAFDRSLDRLRRIIGLESVRR